MRRSLTATSRSPYLSLAFPDEIMRRDDPKDDKSWLRSDRIFYRDDGWYVATREGDLGPFPGRSLAVIELNRYFRELKLRHSIASLKTRTAVPTRSQ